MACPLRRTFLLLPAALFNRIVGQQVAIVYDYPGVTRDRQAPQRPLNCALSAATEATIVAAAGGRHRRQPSAVL